MQTAVLISGQTRNFRECLPTLHWSVFRKLTDPVFFVSVADDAQAADAYLLEGYYKNVFIERVKQPEILEPNPRFAAHAPYAIASSIQGIMRQLWHLNRVYEFYLENAKTPAAQFVRCRPDLWFQEFRPPMPSFSLTLPSGAKSAPSYEVEKVAFTPWYARFGGINDRFAILGPLAAAAYFTTFEKIDALLKSGCPLHPESLVKASLEEAGCAISDHLVAEFSIFKDGKRRFPEIMMEDMAHQCRGPL